MYPVVESRAWGRWMTPRSAREQAVHRWYLFPHSFTSPFVHALIDEWGLCPRQEILDPFAGAGTTLLAARERGIPSTGYDLSPLAVLVSNTKTATFSWRRLAAIWHDLETRLKQNNLQTISKSYPELLRRALPDGRLEALDAISTHIEHIKSSAQERNFFRLALMAILPRFSQAVASGGWLRWSMQGSRVENITSSFKSQVEIMLSDVRNSRPRRGTGWRTRIADARSLPAPDAKYSAVISSPPYPNRHDYTRVFTVELMFACLPAEDIRTLRYQTFQSHPEAKPNRPCIAKRYRSPKMLEDCISALADSRIRRMLEGYFLDMYLCLHELSRVCRQGAKIALVVGNAQYDGRAVLVDELTANLGERTGLICREIRAVRWRGNSAQQMGKYGRRASRESVVLFEKK